MHNAAAHPAAGHALALQAAPRRFDVRIAAIACVVISACFLARASASGAVTFGVNYDNLVANNTQWTCGNPFGPYPVPYPGYGGSSSCSVFSPGGLPKSANPISTEGFAVPLPDPGVKGVTETTGTITEVRIKTGSIPAGSARARLAVYRSQNLVAQTACCTGKSVSATFTLTPNTIVRAKTDFKVSSTRNGNYLSSDWLALEILDPNTPIPAALSNVNDLIPYLSTIFAPPIAVGEERFTSGITAPIIPLMQADLTIDPIKGGNDPAPSPAPGPTPIPTAPAKPAGKINVRGKTVRASVTPQPGVTYSIVGSEIKRAKAASGIRTVTGKCKANAKSKKVDCSVKLAKGRWTVSVIPNKGGISGKALSKAVGIK